MQTKALWLWRKFSILYKSSCGTILGPNLTDLIQNSWENTFDDSFLTRPTLFTMNNIIYLKTQNRFCSGWSHWTEFIE